LWLEKQPKIDKMMEKWYENGRKTKKMAKNGIKMAEKWTKNDKNGKKWYRMAKNAIKIAKNG
jgi:hypothetical protein